MLIEVLKFEAIFMVEGPLTSYIVKRENNIVRVHSRCVPVNRSQKLIVVKFRLQGVSSSWHKIYRDRNNNNNDFNGSEVPGASVVQYLPTPDFTTVRPHFV